MEDLRSQLVKVLILLRKKEYETLIDKYFNHYWLNENENENEKLKKIIFEIERVKENFHKNIINNEKDNILLDIFYILELELYYPNKPIDKDQFFRKKTNNPLLKIIKELIFSMKEDDNYFFNNKCDYFLYNRYGLKYIIWDILIKINIYNDYLDQIQEDLSLVNSQNNKFNLLAAIIIKFYILNILTIRFNTQFERKVAHYTNIDVALKLIKGNSYFRLNSTEFMNDPSEGSILFEFLQNNINNSNTYSQIFSGCFTFNHNSLNQFRLYGRKDHIECSGISLTINKNYFQAIKKNICNLYRCIYLEPITGSIKLASRNKISFIQEHSDKKKFKIDILYKKYQISIDLKKEKIEAALNILKYYTKPSNQANIISSILTPLAYLIKHSAFLDEDECRIIEKIDLSSKRIKYYSPTNTTFIENNIKLNQYITNIYLGASIKELQTYIKTEIAKLKWKNIPKVKVCEAPYRAHQIINRIN